MIQKRITGIVKGNVARQSAGGGAAHEKEGGVTLASQEGRTY